jgi:hypothetical protein
MQAYSRLFPTSHLSCSSPWKGCFCPFWNKTPFHQRKLPDRFLRMPANNRNWLGRGDIVARLPIIVPGNSVELLNDDLPPAR